MGLAGIEEGFEMKPDTTGFVTTLVNACDSVCRRRVDGSDAKLFLLSCHERLREDLDPSRTSALAPSLFIALDEEELDDGGVGYGA